LIEEMPFFLTSDEQELSSRVVHHYPHQVVVVNTQPELGTTLSSMANQEEDASKEEKVATNTLSTTKTQCKSRRPSVKVIYLHGYNNYNDNFRNSLHLDTIGCAELYIHVVIVLSSREVCTQVYLHPHIFVRATTYKHSTPHEC